MQALFITGIVFGIIGFFIVVASICVGHVEGFDSKTTIFEIIALIVCIIICLVGVIVPAEHFSNTEEIIEEREIISLERDNNTSSFFMLGSGYIKNEQVYYFYIKEKGMYKLDHVNAESTYIVETNSIKPCIIEKRDKGDFFSHKTIYVPVGTIIKDFRV